MTETTYLTTTEAARRAAVSRPTISRAIKSQELPAKYDNSAKWLISATDLDAWAEKRGPSPTVRADHTVSALMNAQILRLEQTCETLRRDLSEARETASRLAGEGAAIAAERDRLADLLRTSLQARPVEIVAPVRGRPSIIARIFGR